MDDPNPSGKPEETNQTSTSTPVESFDDIDSLGPGGTPCDPKLKTPTPDVPTQPQTDPTPGAGAPQT